MVYWYWETCSIQSYLKITIFQIFFFLNQQNNKLLEDIQKITIKNTILDNEIKDLSSSTHALENFARYNLGLVKKDETFVQVIKK